MTDSSPVLKQLMQVILERKEKRPAHSYTTRLLDEGLSTIGRKVNEEAGELIEAAAEQSDPDHHHFVHEAADLVYHLLVLLAWRGVALEAVEAELAKRFGISGLDEKASRGPK